MISFKPAVLSAAVLFSMSIAPSLKADTWNKKTVITISETITLPMNTVLQPGTYVFKLADFAVGPSHRPDLQCHRNTYYRHHPGDPRTTGCSRPARACSSSGKRRRAAPKAMRAWFYPGDNFGQEFVYPKIQSLEIAKITRTPVPTVLVENDVVDVAVLKAAPVVVVTEKGEEEPLVLTAQNNIAAESAPSRPYADAAPTTASTLPRTASSLPLMGLVDLASLGAFGLLVCLPKRKIGLATPVVAKNARLPVRPGR